MKSDLMVYKDYYSSVYYSEEDQTFFGKIEGINDSITFEGESVQELKTAFAEAVEDYLALCKEIGKEPLKPYKGTFNVRIESELHKKVAIEAAKRGISLNQLVEEAIKDKVEHKLSYVWEK